MSTATTVPVQPTPKDASSTTAITTNPFDTPFDGGGDESDEEWWSEDDRTTSNLPKGLTTKRITEWPKPLEVADAGLAAKPKPRTSTRKPPDKRYSVQKPTRDKSKGRQRKQNAKAGIKVVTNFTRYQGIQAATQAGHLLPSKTMPQRGLFVDLAALQALDAESTQPLPLGFWKPKKNGLASAPKKKPSTSNEETQNVAPLPQTSSSKSRTSSGPTLSPIKLELGDLSPNDRPIIIGISIPVAKMGEQSVSPQRARSDTTKSVQSQGNRAQTSYTPDTPTITVTNAQNCPSWPPSEENGISPRDYPRPSSSFYSQAPQNAMGKCTQGFAPPVTEMPATILEGKTQGTAALKSCFSPDSDDDTLWGDEDIEHDKTSASRIVSSYTVFEEDESPILARLERATTLSPKSAKHASTRTIATLRRSKGWWNYITTPFLTRSNTVATRGVFEDQEPPVVPSLAIAATKAQELERDGKSWEKQFSPSTPEAPPTLRPDSWGNATSKEDLPNDTKSAAQPPNVDETEHGIQESGVNSPLVSSHVASLGGISMPGIASNSTESQLDCSMPRASLYWRSFGSDPTDREIRLVSDSSIAEGTRSSNPYTQPRLTDLNSSSNIQSASRHVVQTLPTALVLKPPQPTFPPGQTPPPVYSPAASHIPRYRVIFPPGHTSTLQYPVSPGPLSPGMQLAMSTGGGIPLSVVPLTPTVRRPINLNSGYQELPSTQALNPQRSSKNAQRAEAKRRRHEKEDAVARRAGGLWRGRGCISDRGCYGRSGAEGRKRRRWYFGLIAGFLSTIILVIVLAETLHRKSNTVVGPSQWLNLTGFPPIYTGLSTVAAPVNIVTNTACVFPATKWSCDLPKELQASVEPNQPNQPNFLLQIQWDNSSSTNATFANVTGNSNLGTRELLGNPVYARHFIRSLLVKARQIVTFAPNPAPPSYEEQFFLGTTTDGIVSANKAGEPTPFYISFLQPTSSSKTKRQVLPPQDSATSFPNVSAFIPAPSLNNDGTAAPANLLPFPVQQPIRLYDRGLPTEHYGFYTYFDRSIFLESISQLNSSDSDNGEVPDDENGGATEAEAAFRCTWAQTRFLVQMWTRMNSTARLLNGTASASSSGADFVQPGSFPYPITVTSDRHGGDPNLKMIYCYQMNGQQGIISTSGQISTENRGFGGTEINPAPSVFSNTTNLTLGGYDGGTGGCSCQWSNFQKVTNT